MLRRVRLYRRKRPSYGRKERSSTLGSIKRSFLLLFLSLSLSPSSLFPNSLWPLWLGGREGKGKEGARPKSFPPKKDNYVLRCPFVHLLSKIIVLCQSTHTTCHFYLPTVYARRRFISQLLPSLPFLCLRRL